MRLWMTVFFVAAVTTMIVGCKAGVGTAGGTSDSASLQVPEDDRPVTEDPKPDMPGVNDWSDAAVKLDSFGELYAAAIANELQGSKYMEDNCVADRSWAAYGDLPVIRCQYGLGGQRAEVVMLNPGPRRLTAWLVDACKDLSQDLRFCVDRGYNYIIYQSGAQFPITGVVLEDMSRNGKGEAFAFREGVTVRIDTFGTGTESIINSMQVAAAMVAPVVYTYSYGRPISVTREQMTAYAATAGLAIPVLGRSSERKNNWHELIGKLYRESWATGRSHIIRAWLSAQVGLE